ncbi:MAG: hypothetical protein Q8R87_04275, partial [Anaerolineaceae bacterium]|nr:hypothetical protein [Anaerolineaceae bacterium]
MSSSISRLSTTPTLFLTFTPEATSTATFTATPTETATPTVTPTATATATATPCAEISGTVNKVSVPSDALGVSMPVSIYLPHCYDIADNY